MPLDAIAEADNLYCKIKALFCEGMRFHIVSVLTRNSREFKIFSQ